MAVNRADAQAAKEAKQKKILIALSVVFVGLLVWQLPKLMGGKEAAPPATAATATDPAATPAATPDPATVAAGGEAIPVAPVAAPPNLAAAAAGSRPKATTAQLVSFSLFEAKDPFVQKIVEKSETEKAASAPSTPAKGADVGAGGKVVGGIAAPKVIYAFATLSVNGESEGVQAKTEFPTSEPMFVVVSIGKGQVKIGIAGGKLSNGKAATIKLGKSLTLVDNATGARYVITLLYTGAEPEATESFTSDAGAAVETSPATAVTP